MKIHLVNPSDTAFGTAVITPRWLYVLSEYVHYYHSDRTYLELNKDTPCGRVKAKPNPDSRVVSLPRLWWLASSLRAGRLTFFGFANSEI
jgi:hypothetical protein